MLGTVNVSCAGLALDDGASGADRPGLDRAEVTFVV
jgi:hypothetical protein